MNLDPLAAIISATAARVAPQMAMAPADVAGAILDHLLTLADNGPGILGSLVDQLQREAAPPPPQPMAPTFVAEVEACTRLIHPNAAATMRAELARWPGREISFVLTRLECGRFGNPSVWMRGSADKTYHPTNVNASHLLVHNHPGGDLTPSDRDLAAAATISGTGAGDAVIDDCCVRAYPILEPAPAIATGGADGNA